MKEWEGGGGPSLLNTDVISDVIRQINTKQFYIYFAHIAREFMLLCLYAVTILPFNASVTN